MEQIVDLQAAAAFQSLGVQLVSIATDSRADLERAGAEYGITVPLLSDADAQVSRANDVLKWAAASGEPGHTFVLVDRSGRIAWIRDYGAPANGGVMYVPVEELVREITPRL